MGVECTQDSHQVRPTPPAAAVRPKTCRLGQTTAPTPPSPGTRRPYDCPLTGAPAACCAVPVRRAAAAVDRPPGPRPRRALPDRGPNTAVSPRPQPSCGCGSSRGSGPPAAAGCGRRPPTARRRQPLGLGLRAHLRCGLCLLDDCPPAVGLLASAAAAAAASPAAAVAAAAAIAAPSRPGHVIGRLAERGTRHHAGHGAGTPPHGLSANTMAPITTDCDAMRSLRTIWP